MVVVELMEAVIPLQTTRARQTHRMNERTRFVQSMVGGSAAVALIREDFGFFEIDSGLVQALQISDDWMAFSVGDASFVLDPALIASLSIVGGDDEPRHLSLDLAPGVRMLIYPEALAV
jgi:hypothetical protein